MPTGGGSSRRCRTSPASPPPRQSGPSWKRTDWPPAENGEMLAALSGDWQAAEAQVSNRLKERASRSGMELSPQLTLRATQDSIRALQLIRSYRVRGHLVADLDPLGLAERKEHPELLPLTYGFTEADLDRPVFIDNILPWHRNGDRPAGARHRPHRLLRAHRRRVHAHLRPRPAQMDPGADRGQEGQLHRQGQAGDPRQADRRRELRAVLPD